MLASVASSLQGLHRHGRARHEYQSSRKPASSIWCTFHRLESVIRGREKFERNTHAGGLTNLEKERKKNYLMVRKGTALKRKTRLGDKQVGELTFAVLLVVSGA